MLVTKVKYICSVCQNKIPKQKDQFFTCPVCKNTAQMNEIIDDFITDGKWTKIKRWLKWDI